MTVTPEGNYECVLQYYICANGLHVANFVPLGEEHPLSPGECECGAEPKKYIAGWFIQHKPHMKYITLPTFMPEEV